jgi:SNF2 family DNA or RNA helicase
LKEGDVPSLEIKENEFYYTASDGSVSRPVAEALIGMLRSSELMEHTANLGLQVHTRPSEIRFSTALNSGQLGIVPLINGIPARKEQLKQIGDLGYFLQGKHLYFYTQETRRITDKYLAVESPSDKLKFLASIDQSLFESREFEGYARHISETIGADELAEDGELIVPLYPYQNRGLQWLLHCYSHGIGTILADDMGLGKTAQVIALITKLIATRTLEHAVIVVPNTLIDNWVREFEFFTGTIRPYVHKGSIRTGLSENLQKENIVIVPYSIMSNDISMLEELRIDLLVFDEASLLKNPDSQRTRAALRLDSFMTVAITGTPVDKYDGSPLRKYNVWSTRQLPIVQSETIASSVE